MLFVPVSKEIVVFQDIYETSYGYFSVSLFVEVHDLSEDGKVRFV